MQIIIYNNDENIVVLFIHSFITTRKFGMWCFWQITEIFKNINGEWTEHTRRWWNNIDGICIRICLLFSFQVWYFDWWMVGSLRNFILQWFFLFLFIYGFNRIKHNSHTSRNVHFWYLYWMEWGTVYTSSILGCVDIFIFMWWMAHTHTHRQFAYSALGTSTGNRHRNKVVHIIYLSKKKNW